MKSNIIDDDFFENIQTEPPILDDRVRFANYLIDFFPILFSYIFWGAMDGRFPLFLIYLYKGNGNELINDKFWDIIVPLMISCLILKFIYYFVFELSSRRTLGKYFTKTIVVIDDPNKSEFGQIVLRSLIRLIPFEGLVLLFKDAPLHDLWTSTSLRFKE